MQSAYFSAISPHLVVALQRLADLVGQFLQLLDDPHPGREAQVPQPAEVQGQHRQHRALRGERLGRGHADLRSGAEVDAAVGLLGDRAADHVADAQRGMALALHLPQGGQRVGRLAALRDGEHQRVVVQRRIAVAQLAGVFDFDRQPGQGLDLVLAHQGRVPTRAAGGHHEAPHRAELLRREVQAAELGRGRVEVEPAAHGVLDRLGLLEDLLEHVVGVAAQVDVAGLEVERAGRGGRRGPESRWIDPQRVGREHGQLVVGQVDDLVGVAGQRRGVAGDEVLAVAHADHQRAAQPGGDHHLRPVAKDDRQAVGPLELRQGVAAPRPPAAGSPAAAMSSTGGCRFRQLAIRWAMTSVSVAERNS